jgi:hypothetical protein
LRPRNAQPLGTGGIARLGNSFLSPVLSEFVSNGSPGSPADSFITVENRLSQPLTISPAFQDGSPDYNQYFTVPPLTRSTAPIDPQRGVLITADNGIRLIDRSSGTMLTRTFEKRTIPYRLHSDGAAPSEPLYPLDRCLMAEQDVSTLTTVTLFCGPGWPQVGANKVADGIDGMVFAAVTIMIQSGVVPANSLIQMNAFYDSSNPTQRTGGWTPFVTGDGAGTMATIALNGATAVEIGIGGTIVAMSLSMMFWVGIPGS